MSTKIWNCIKVSGRIQVETNRNNIKRVKQHTWIRNFAIAIATTHNQSSVVYVTFNTLTATRVFTEISVRPRVTKRSLLGTSIDILVMRVNNFFNKPFSYFLYNNSIVLLFPLEYLFKYLRQSFASGQISATRIRMTRPYRKLCCHPNVGVVAVNVLKGA